MSRNLLAKHKLPAFEAWLSAEGVDHRPGRGDHQMLQVYMPNGTWQCIFNRHSSPEHYTVATPLEPLVRRFIEETKK